MSEDEEIWCPTCDEYKILKCNQPEEVEKKLIVEIIEDLNEHGTSFGRIINKWKEKLQ